jgi:hypothetical protein
MAAERLDFWFYFNRFVEVFFSGELAQPIPAYDIYRDQETGFTFMVNP